MRTPNLPKLPINKKVVLVTLGLLVVLLVTAFGIVKQEQANQAATKQATADRAAQVAKDHATAARIQSLQTQTTQLTAQKTALCNYIKSLEANKATKLYVTTPTAGACSNPQ